MLFDETPIGLRRNRTMTEGLAGLARVGQSLRGSPTLATGLGPLRRMLMLLGAIWIAPYIFIVLPRTAFCLRLVAECLKSRMALGHPVDTGSQCRGILV